jgi:hypothetical protein
MADYVLIDGDRVTYLPNFSPATVVVQPGKLAGSGPGKVQGKPIAVDGDEQSASVRGCMYVTPQYSIPGTGTLEIAALASDQVARKTRTGGKPMLLLGGSFTAAFKVQTPAQQPPPGPGAPIPDPTQEYSGQGFFVASNREFRGL